MRDLETTEEKGVLRKELNVLGFVQWLKKGLDVLVMNKKKNEKKKDTS